MVASAGERMGAARSSEGREGCDGLLDSVLLAAAAAIGGGYSVRLLGVWVVVCLFVWGQETWEADFLWFKCRLLAFLEKATGRVLILRSGSFARLDDFTEEQAASYKYHEERPHA
jgi:hypothetical protein